MDFQIARKRMVERYVAGAGVADVRVLKAMEKVHRHRFVEEAFAAQAYGDKALPIGHGQTISQPATVGRMTEALGLAGGEKVLEIGTGSGYQTAVLAELCRKVYTVERLLDLVVKAKSILLDLGYDNVFFRQGDGSLGWEKEAPFDRILVTAGAPAVPAPLLSQLKPGGRLIVPVTGGRDAAGMLTCVERGGEGFRERAMGSCQFVDLVGREGWPERAE